MNLHTDCHLLASVVMIQNVLQRLVLSAVFSHSTLIQHWKKYFSCLTYHSLKTFPVSLLTFSVFLTHTMLSRLFTDTISHYRQSFFHLRHAKNRKCLITYGKAQYCFSALTFQCLHVSKVLHTSLWKGQRERGQAWGRMPFLGLTQGNDGDSWSRTQPKRRQSHS